MRIVVAREISYPQVIKHGNGKSPINGGFTITDQWSIFQHAVFDYQRVNIFNLLCSWQPKFPILFIPFTFACSGALPSTKSYAHSIFAEVFQTDNNVVIPITNLLCGDDSEAMVMLGTRSFLSLPHYPLGIKYGLLENPL